MLACPSPSRPRSGWKRRLLLPLLLAPLALLPALGDSRAEPPPEGFPGSAEEYDTYALYKSGKLLTARTSADALLKADPGSIIGNFVMGSVLRDAEGSLPRAMNLLRRANTLYETRYGRTGPQDQQLHMDILWGIQSTASLMEQFVLQLQVLDYYDSLFSPPAVAQHAWPLMKLRRFAEARDYAHRGLASDNDWQQLLGLNALCAIEAEDHQRQASYDACKAAYEHAHQRALESRETDPDRVPRVAVHAYNAAESALTVLRFDEAERVAIEGTRRLERTATNPWRLLSWIYLNEGRANDAVASLREMQRWCAHQPPDQRDQKSAETDGVVATVLLAAGEAEDGLQFIDRALERPDWFGLDSSNAEQTMGTHALVRRALRRLEAELASERASWQGLARRGTGMLGAATDRAEAWPDDERIIAVLADEMVLDMTVRPYQDGGLEFLAPWLTGDLVEILGPGIVAAAVTRARAEEVALPGMAAYFDALDAEVALARGDTSIAVRFAQGALEQLPQAEALLRARVAAVGGEAAWREGDARTSLGLFEKALQADPGATRRLGLAIPASVRVDGGGAAAERAAVLLGRSPRLREASGAFQVLIDSDAAGLRACLLTPLGAQLSCATAPILAGDTPDDTAAHLAEEFHRAAFAMRFSLTPTDLRSLDGSTTMAQGSAREALRGLLGDPPAPPPK